MDPASIRIPIPELYDPIYSVCMKPSKRKSERQTERKAGGTEESTKSSLLPDSLNLPIAPGGPSALWLGPREHMAWACVAPCPNFTMPTSKAHILALNIMRIP